MPLVSSPLADIRVVELAEGIAGPYAAKVLADMGDEGIKVEPPFRGDRSRYVGPFPGHEPHPERSGQFLYLNTNKLGVTLDLEQSTGVELFAQLVAQADVLIEDREPGWLSARGSSSWKCRVPVTSPGLGDRLFTTRKLPTS